MIIVFLLLGVALGHWMNDEGGFVVGGALGTLLGWLVSRVNALHRATGGAQKIDALEERLRELDGRLSYLEHRLQELGSWVVPNLHQLLGAREMEAAAIDPEPAHPTEPAAPAAKRTLEPQVPPTTPAAPMARRQEPAAEPEQGSDEAARAETHPPEVAAPTPLQEPFSPIPKQLSSEGPRTSLSTLLFGGNTVARVGLFVLLVGVVLLLKYAAEHALFPIELRMASAGLLGLGLVIVGFRQRKARPGFSRTLEGGGVAAMYLVVFFSFRRYELIPGELAFALLVVIAASSAVIAILEDALSLVVIGELGGFLAPVLASTGSGNHVALFSYNLVLNLAIFGIAWYRAWRPLNILGFVCTFGIGTTWGALQYDPEKFWTTEPFLVAFFLLYVAIPVLYAFRKEARGFVDAGLVFGAPLAFLGLQYALAADVPFAMAYTTLGLGALYLGLVTLLLKERVALETLRETFLALSVGFLTLAIPYGFDNAGLTGATWAVEGAGIYFVGVRQKRRLSRFAAAGLILLAGIALLWHAKGAYPEDALPVLNVRALGSLLVGLGALFVAEHAYRHREKLESTEWRVLQGLIAWALLFLVPAGYQEIERHAPHDAQPGLTFGWFGLLGLLFEIAGERLAWRPIRYVTACAGALAGLWVLAFSADVEGHLFTHAGVLGWPLLFLSVWLSLYRFVPEAPRLRPLHLVGLFNVALFWGVELYLFGLGPLELGQGWALAGLGGSLVVLLWLLTGLRDAKVWPLTVERELYLGPGRDVLAALVLLFCLVVNVYEPGDARPLAFLPIVNPLELTELFGLFGVFWLLKSHTEEGRVPLWGKLPVLLWASGFLAWNAALARAVHHLEGVPWDLDELWASVSFHVTVSVSWTLLGLIVTVGASKLRRREVWFAGASLLGVVVGKLFLVDLARLSTLPKIGTFLAVGLLLLLVGYFAPLPPRDASTEPANGPPKS